MLESAFLEDCDDIGTKVAKKGLLLPKSGINSELVSIQRVKLNNLQSNQVKRTPLLFGYVAYQFLCCWPVYLI